MFINMYNEHLNSRCGVGVPVGEFRYHVEALTQKTSHYTKIGKLGFIFWFFFFWNFKIGNFLGFLVLVLAKILNRKLVNLLILFFHFLAYSMILPKI